ncbi:hypothetical protein B0H14DRAFT_2581569 [Mycena olivaceomarginata]|nr:hypothetical protein B0H14DRAFT_2581569 [Mycena olivaceomarginata]
MSASTFKIIITFNLAVSVADGVDGAELWSVLRVTAAVDEYVAVSRVNIEGNAPKTHSVPCKSKTSVEMLAVLRITSGGGDACITESGVYGGPTRNACLSCLLATWNAKKRIGDASGADVGLAGQCKVREMLMALLKAPVAPTHRVRRLEFVGLQRVKSGKYVRRSEDGGEPAKHARDPWN